MAYHAAPNLVVLFLTWIFVNLLPSISITVRRLHDIGLPGAMFFLGFVPYIGGIIVTILMCLPTNNAKAQQYNTNPPPHTGR